MAKSKAIESKIRNMTISTMLMKLKNTRKQKNEPIQEQPTPALPPAIWTDHIYGFLDDRKSFNTISLLNTEIRKAMKNVTKPWPTDLELLVPGKKDDIDEVYFSPDGRTLIGRTVCTKRIHVWNIDAGFQTTLEPEYGAFCHPAFGGRCIQFSKDGKFMLSCVDY